MMAARRDGFYQRITAERRGLRATAARAQHTSEPGADASEREQRAGVASSRVTLRAPSAEGQRVG
ncbi:MAG: hypothetical protein CMJ88_09480 [Planctomycetes bacterium]|nr:hypothetical protein [Planctomycetota bacterium]